MTRARMERRSFLKAATQTMLAAAAVSALGRMAEAQQTSAVKPGTGARVMRLR